MNEMVMSKASVQMSRCAADVVDVLQNREKLSYGEVLERLEAVLNSYGLHPNMPDVDVDELKAVARMLSAAFGASDMEAASTLNDALQKYAAIPRLAMAKDEWQLTISGSGAGWSEQFAASAAMALAVLFADKQRNPAGVCTSATCQRPYIDLGKGGGRSYCTPRCATRERVAQYRKLKKENA